MIVLVPCIKCGKDTARFTYEENRVYKVSCECGHSYEFNHCSFDDALKYHHKMVILHREIDRNEQLQVERDKAIEDLKEINSCLVCINYDGTSSFICEKFKTNKEPHFCIKWQWRGLEVQE